MSRLEDELRNALRREEPPEGFAARVLARAAAAPEPRRARAWTRLTGWFRAPVFARAAMAGALCLVVVLGVHYEQRQQLERVRGEAAKRQLLLALRVTGSSLRAVHDKVHELSAGYSDAQ
jgi:negative regulator of sigma E activity